MTITTFLSIIVVCLISSNAITATMAGVDLVGNNFNSIKHSLAYSLYLFGIMLVSGLIIYLANLILIASDMAGFLVVIGLIIISIVVQMAEFLMEKLTPILYSKVKHLIVVLIPVVFVILMGFFNEGVRFGELLLEIFFSAIGITIVLSILSGIRQNRLPYSPYKVFNGNLMTMVILFVLTLAWMAI